MQTDKPIIFQPALIRAILDGRKTQTRRLVKKPKNCPPDLTISTSVLGDKSMVWFRSNFKGVGYSCPCPYGRPGGNLWARENFVVQSARQGWESSSEAGVDFEEGAAALYYPADGARRTVSGLIIRDDGIDEGEQAVRLRTGKTVPSIHMPRWASRIDLALEAVRAERVNQITEEDAMAEGFHQSAGGLICFNECGPDDKYFHTAREAFKMLWNRIHGAPAAVYAKGEESGGKKQISHYVSYPWEDGDRTEEHNGRPHHIHGNPYVWVLQFTPKVKVC